MDKSRVCLWEIGPLSLKSASTEPAASQTHIRKSSVQAVEAQLLCVCVNIFAYCSTQHICAHYADRDNVLFKAPL